MIKMLMLVSVSDRNLREATTDAELFISSEQIHRNALPGEVALTFDPWIKARSARGRDLLRKPSEQQQC